MRSGGSGAISKRNVLKNQAGWMTVFALRSGASVASLASREPVLGDRRSPNTCGKRMISTLNSAVVTGVVAAVEMPLSDIPRFVQCLGCAV